MFEVIPLIWVLCGLLDLIVFPSNISDEIGWVPTIIMAILFGPIILYEDWMDYANS